MSFNWKDKHTKGKDCKTCCCSGATKCSEPGCDGWVHQDVVDEIEYGDGDWTWMHNYKCDTCGTTSYFNDEPGYEVEFEEET